MSRTKKSPSKPPIPHGRKLADFMPLLPAEQKLLEAVAIGEVCWLCDKENRQRPKQKTKDNEIRATFIRFLALGGDEEAFVHEKGVQVVGAFVGGVLDLSSCNNVKSLLIQFSKFETPLNLVQTTIEYLDLTFSFFPDFNGADIHIKSNFNLIKIKTLGTIILINAQINGSLNCMGADLTANSTHPKAMTCDRIKVLGDIQLSNHFKSIGEVSFTNANILGDFVCLGGHFSVLDGEEKALSCDGMYTRNKIHLGNNFRADGEVRFISANVGGDFICDTGQFYNINKTAFFCDQITIEGSLFLRKQCRINGLVSFIGARIKGLVDCRISHFQNPNNTTLDFETAKIGGDVLLSNNFRAEGEVRFKNAQIGGDFICENDSSIKHPRNTDNPTGHALHCGGIRVGGNVLLRQNPENDSKLEINGSVNFMDARIGKGFECSHVEISHFVPSDKGSEIAAYALNLQGADIGGILTMKKADIYGSISLLKAHVDSLNDDEASWPQPAITQKSGIIRKIKDFFCAISDRLKPKPQDRTAIFNENKAEPENQEDEEEQEEKDSLQSVESDDSKPAAPPEYDVSRPKSHGALSSVLSLDGFTYNQFAGNAPTKAETRLKWLMLQKPSALWTNFRPQPFEQLTKVLRNTGYEEQATQLLIHKYDHKQDVRIAQAKGVFASLWAWLLSLFFSFFLGLLTGYGKRPARVFGLLVFLWASAAFWYHKAAEQDVFAPSHPLIFLKYDQKPDCRINWAHCIKNANDDHNPEFQAYTVFSAPLYSLDVMLPILNLHQEGDWGPKMKALKILGVNMPPASTWFVMWSQIILGWLGSFMLIAMLSGWMQKE